MLFQNDMTASFCAHKKQGRLPKIQQLPVHSRVVSKWVDSNRIDQGTSVEKMALAAFLLALLGLVPMASSASWNYSGKLCYVSEKLAKPHRNILLSDPDTDWASLGECGSSTNQSPINLTSADAETRDMRNFTTSMGYKIYSTGKVINSGYSSKRIMVP